MNGQRIGYVRVSSLDQNPDRQLESIPMDRVFKPSQSLPSVHLQYRWQENGVIGAEHDGRFSLRGKQSSKWDTGKVGHFLATAKANPCRGCCG